MKAIFLRCGLCLACMVSVEAWGVKGSSDELDTKQAASSSVDIRSDRLVVHQKKRLAVFSGNVRTVQDNVTIQCDKLEVRYLDSVDSNSGIGSIASMVFTGSVQILQNERKGHCDRAEYDRKRGRIVCTGDPWVIEGKNQVKGDRIEYFLHEDEFRVIHPKAIITMPEQKRKVKRRKP